MDLIMTKGSVLDNYAFWRPPNAPQLLSTMHPQGPSFIYVDSNSSCQKVCELYDISRLFPKLAIKGFGMKQIEILPLKDETGYVIREKNTCK